MEPARSNSFLFPFVSKSPTFQTQHNLNTLWHEAMDHGFDSRMRQGIRGQLADSEIETFAQLLGGYGAKRNALLPNSPKALDPYGSAIEEYNRRFPEKPIKLNPSK